LTRRTLCQKYAISDDAVQKEYDSRQSEFQVPEKRAIVQVVLPDEAAAKDLADKVRQGTPFADAVKAAPPAIPSTSVR
jgi:peptidyl-prolyl cis-trans isomerase D